MFIYGRTVIPLHSLSSKSRNSKMFTHSDFKIALSFAIIGSIATTSLEFVNNARKFENKNFIYEPEKINQLPLSLACNSKMAVGQLIFHYTINFSANLKWKFIQIW